MKSIYLLFFCATLLSSCHNDKKLSLQNDVLITNENFKLDHNNGLKDSIVPQTENFYLFENDTLKQTVKVDKRSENEIYFKFISENKYRKQMVTIEGIAKNEYFNFGMEIDEDEEGNAYPANEYIYEGTCWLAFRIEMDNAKYLQINQADCQEYNPFCPLESIGILLKQ